MKVFAVLTAWALWVLPLLSLAEGVRYRGIFVNDEDWGLRPWFGTFFDRRSKNAAEVKTLVDYCRRCNYMLRLGVPKDGAPDIRVLSDGTEIRFTEDSLFEVCATDGAVMTCDPITGSVK